MRITASEAGSTRQRIRDAAVSAVGQLGAQGATVRVIAARAGVPIGLVSYHFGSKEGLLEACDEWLIGQTLAEKDFLTDDRPRINPMQVITDDPQIRLVMDYLMQRMRGGGQAAQRLFDVMTHATEEVLEAGVEAGTIGPVADLTATSAILVAHSAGTLAHAGDIARQLGGTDLLGGEVVERYATASLDLFTNGLFVANPMAETSSQPTAAGPHPNDPAEPDPTKES